MGGKCVAPCHPRISWPTFCSSTTTRRSGACWRRTLVAEGYSVEAAADGGAALAAVERSVPDAIVLDVTMPGIDGLAVTRRLRAKGLRVPILLLTARDAVHERVAGLDAGADDYLVKPFDADELTARVRALLRRNAPVSDEVLAFADLVLQDGIARRGGVDLELTPREAELLGCSCATRAASSPASWRWKRSGARRRRPTRSTATSPTCAASSATRR